MQPLPGLHEPRLHQFLIEPAHRGEVLLAGHHARLGVPRRLDDHHDSHCDSSFRWGRRRHVPASTASLAGCAQTGHVAGPAPDDRLSPWAEGIASRDDLPGPPGVPRDRRPAPRRLQQRGSPVLPGGGRVQRRPLRSVLRSLAPGRARGSPRERVGRDLRELRAHGAGAVRPHDQLHPPPAVARGDPRAAPRVRDLRRRHPRPALLDLLLRAGPLAGRGGHEGLRAEGDDVRGPPGAGRARGDAGLLHFGELGRLRGQLRSPAGRSVPRRHRDTLLRRSPRGHGRSGDLRCDLSCRRLLRRRGPRQRASSSWA